MLRIATVRFLCLTSIVMFFTIGLFGFAGNLVKPAAAGAESAVEDRRVAQRGDLVAAKYTLTLENGSLVRTTFAEVAADPSQPKAEAYEAPKGFVPEEVVAGDNSSVPGLAEAVLGLPPGGRRDVVVPAEKGYGPSDPAKIAHIRRVKRVPKTFRLPAAEYVKQFGTFPAVGKEVALGPYLMARVAAVTETEAELTPLASEGRVEEPFGSVETRMKGEQVVIRLIPRIGATFAGPGAEGRITGADNDAFTVDFNHPLAGKALKLHVEVASLTKASQLENVRIAWYEDHDRGLDEAKRIRKPAVLVLYAGWCGWCKKFLGETVLDPRIRMLNDKFVWVKVNSDQEKKYHELYRQAGFPTIVLLNPDGTVVRKLDGYRDASNFQGELSVFLRELQDKGA